VVEIGSHTHTHALLDRLAPEAIADELDRSVTLVHERVGCPVRHFAYPKALAPTPDADRAVRARFASAALAGTRPNRFGATDPWALSRSPIQTADGFDYFVAKAMGGMQLEDTARRLVNRVRYAGATQ
jgi:peptidoglycan/xylan/chitin deacetylase (PgdA/CDA1 family)